MQKIPKSIARIMYYYLPSLFSNRRLEKFAKYVFEMKPTHRISSGNDTAKMSKTAARIVLS